MLEILGKSVLALVAFWPFWVTPLAIVFACRRTQ